MWTVKNVLNHTRLCFDNVKLLKARIKFLTGDNIKNKNIKLHNVIKNFSTNSTISICCFNYICRVLCLKTSAFSIYVHTTFTYFLNHLPEKNNLLLTSYSHLFLILL